MLTKEELQSKIRDGLLILDGATGSNLMRKGMPRGCCTESWVLEHPDAIMELQSAYAAAGSQIIYAPTFQAQPVALDKVGLGPKTEEVNRKLVALTRQAAPEALVAGDIATLAGHLDSWNPALFDEMVLNYRRQIAGLLEGGVDLLAAETLLYPQEAEAILTAAELEGAGACIYTFTMQPDGALFSGADAAPILRELEQAGAAAVGFNCVAAGVTLTALVSKLRRTLRGPLVCKPNAGNPVISEAGIAEYPMEPEEFAAILADCKALGANLLGGCCGTDPRYIQLLAEKLR